MLSANVWIGQMIDRRPVRAGLERLVDDAVVQVPGNVWPGSPWNRERETWHSVVSHEM